MLIRNPVNRPVNLLAFVTLLFMLCFPSAAVASGAIPPNLEAIQRVEVGELTEANALWWGFDPEDATESLQAAIDSGVERLIIPNVGADWIVRPIFLRSNQELIFEEGVHIVAKRGEYLGRTESLLNIVDVENVTLRGYGATIRMHKEDYRRPPYEKAEWRHGIAIFGSRNVTVLGFTIRDTGGDGIEIAQRRLPYSENVVIRDIVAENNYRQGISVISARNLLIENSVFRHTGGTPPMAGIDIEPFLPNQWLENIVVRNNLFEDNQGDGIVIYLNFLDDQSPPVSIWIENNIVRGNSTGFVLSTDSASPPGEIYFRQNVIEGTIQSGIHIGRKSGDALFVLIENSLLKDVARSPAAVPITFDSKLDTTGALTMRNVVVADTKNRPVVKAEGRYDDVTAEIRVLNGHGVWPAPELEGLHIELVPSTSEFVYYLDPPSELRITPVVRFVNLNDFGASARVRGLVKPEIALSGFEPDELRSVTIYLDGELLYTGPTIPEPDAITIDTVALNPEKRNVVPHELRVVAEGAVSGRVEGVVTLSARNYWSLRDPFAGPRETGWFGALYHPLTVEQSDGWSYVTDHAEEFGGDADRKVRSGNTTEYLIWETPSLEDVRITLFARDIDLADVIDIAVSQDNEEWVSLPYRYRSEPLENSTAGWYKVTVTAEVPAPSDVEFARLMLRQSRIPKEIQLGEALFVGATRE